MKIRPVGAEMFHADERMNGQDDANCHNSQFCECPYNVDWEINVFKNCLQKLQYEV
jgi:hypothetical protein